MAHEVVLNYAWQVLSVMFKMLKVSKAVITEEINHASCYKFCRASYDEVWFPKYFDYFLKHLSKNELFFKYIWRGKGKLFNYLIHYFYCYFLLLSSAKTNYLCGKKPRLKPRQIKLPYGMEIKCVFARY